MFRHTHFAQILRSQNAEVPLIDLTQTLPEDVKTPTQEIKVEAQTLQSKQHRKSLAGRMETVKEEENYESDYCDNDEEEEEEDQTPKTLESEHGKLAEELEWMRNSMTTILEVLAHYGDAIVSMKTTLDEVSRGQRVLLRSAKENKNVVDHREFETREDRQFDVSAVRSATSSPARQVPIKTEPVNTISNAHVLTEQLSKIRSAVNFKRSFSPVFNSSP